MGCDHCPEPEHATPLTDVEKDELRRLSPAERGERLNEHRRDVWTLGPGSDVDKFAYIDALKEEFNAREALSACSDTDAVVLPQPAHARATDEARW